MENINNALDNFLNKNTPNTITKQTAQGTQVCDLNTGKCETLAAADGLIERVDKTYITKDGKFLLKD